MRALIHSEKKNGFVLKVLQDDHCRYPPWEDYEYMDPSEASFFVAFSDRYLTVTVPGFDKPEDEESFRETHEIFPLYAYIHSGIALSLGAFLCPWDSGQIGVACVCKEHLSDYAQRNGCGQSDAANKIAEGIIKEANDYLQGNVFGYVIEDPDGEEVDSCWGCIGDWDAPDWGALHEGKHSLDWHAAQVTFTVINQYG